MIEVGPLVHRPLQVGPERVRVPPERRQGGEVVAALVAGELRGGSGPLRDLLEAAQLGSAQGALLAVFA